jgi:hypothetical protein
VGELKAQTMNLELNFDNSTNAENSTSAPIVGYAVLGVVLIDFPKNGWCHLVADTIPNLHSFAQSIGLNKCWFQNKRNKNQPHYDVKGLMIDKAIKAGAKQVDSKTIVEFLRQHYT